MENFFLKIWRFEKQIALFERKPPLVHEQIHKQSTYTYSILAPNQPGRIQIYHTGKEYQITHCPNLYFGFTEKCLKLLVLSLAHLLDLYFVHLSQRELLRGVQQPKYVAITCVYQVKMK